jgi:RNA polymerase sigma factor (sigma-70 family)
MRSPGGNTLCPRLIRKAKVVGNGRGVSAFGCHKRRAVSDLELMDDLGRWDDAALLGARERADEAFSVFYRRHVEAVLRFCARSSLSAADAADVTAETFVAALKARRRYQPRGESAQAWLLAIAAHKTAERGRSRWRERRLHDRLAFQPIELSARDHDDYAELLAREEDSLAIAALERLPEGQRAAVHARVVNGDGYDVIAQRLDISEELARQRVSRGLAALRARLNKN